VTKLCCLNRDNPHLSAFKRHVELVASELSWVHWSCRFEASELSHLDYNVWGVMLKKHRKLQPQPKTTDKLKYAWHTIWEELPQERINKTAANFIKRLTVWKLWLPLVITSSICNNSVHLQVCILISSTKPALFRATNRLPVKSTLRMLRNRGLSRLK